MMSYILITIDVTYVYPVIPKLNPALINPPREIKHLVSVNNVTLYRTSTSPIMPLAYYNKDIMDSWKTILTTLVALSNQVGKKKSTVLIGKFRKSVAMEESTNETKLGPRKRGHTRTQSVPISSGTGSSSEGGEIDFTDLDADVSMLSNSSGNQVSFAGTSIVFENKPSSYKTITFASPSVSPNSNSTSTGSYDPSNRPQQPIFDDGIMNQSPDIVQQQQRLKETESSSLFSRFNFDTRDKCPSCNYELCDQDIRSGWSQSAQEYRTTCPQCGTKFVPRLTVIIDKVGSQPPSTSHRVVDGEPPPDEHSDSTLPSSYTPPATPTTGTIINESSTQTSPMMISPQRKFLGMDSPVKRLQQSASTRLSENLRNFMSVIKRPDANTNNNDEGSTGSHHNNSSSTDNMSINYDDVQTYHKLKYEYLSPLVLKKEVENLLSKEVMADAKLFKEHPVIFWNLICHFRGLLIPLNFLLPHVNWTTIMHELTAVLEQSKQSTSSESNSSMSVDDDANMLEMLEKMNNDLMNMQARSKKSTSPPDTK
jgi:hypothetical protein